MQDPLREVREIHHCSIKGEKALKTKTGEVTSLQEELGIKVTEVASLKDTLDTRTAELEARVTSLQEELIGATSLYTWRTKVRLAKQYMEGKTTSWTLENDVNKFLATYGTAANLLHDGVAATAETTAIIESAPVVEDNDATDTNYKLVFSVSFCVASPV